MIFLTYSESISLFTNKKEDWVKEPPDLCMETAAISAPAAIAEIGKCLPK